MRRAGIAILIGAPLLGLIYWVATNTHWVDVKVPMPPQGEALTNPFYAAQRFTETLGARSTRDRILSVPPVDSVIVLADWHWTLSTTRRETLERWVESGGRLVVEGSLAGGEEEFGRWSGIERAPRKGTEPHDSEQTEDDADCRDLSAEHSGSREEVLYKVCTLERGFVLTSTRSAAWSLRDGADVHIIRVPVGRGSVTVINGYPFRYWALFEADHGPLFVGATELRRGDDVHFLSEGDHPSLLALVWHYGAPVVVLAAAFVGLALWRGGVRFGPLIELSPGARRSLAEQIRGTGQFALRHGAGDSLHAACARALQEAAKRRIAGYLHLSAGERLSALARVTGFERHALAAALHHAGSRRSHELRNTIALMEAARRQIMHDPRRSPHATL